ncbi:Deoxyguanosinetriphosphate triphosphohydrolase-like protein [Candidatus Sulfotelmatobacter kueseliae]|uniref:Deoxyguanosinetriphosphate triphosphohydrolase-like protein n=1 Tax=Candidatus Sulfotelmatobacter kueseliae TaxID=2042962 RepID=A0A2U3L546_9BACT|nr:Deoxyguanosinetriphosphate triphosphohydrolase-like protein [Candidatus Sulfotelmatobacter kueseliae]
MLAGYAVHVEHSRGRRFPETQHPYRNDFQRDRDRVIHARAFRRLEAKTQVFTRRYSDHFRNRLTHTLEVSQISRTIAGALGLNVDLAEALALVHDIGHPPFGHAGEKALDTAMRRHGLSFDHNLHALRIVGDFEQRYAAFRGLNLTFEVREGIIKHSRDYHAREHPELAEYLLDQRPPLEAQLIDLTDEIAYNTADLDDGYEAHLLSLEEIRGGVPVFDGFYREVAEIYPAAPDKLKFNEALKRMINRLVGDLITNTQTRLQAAGVQTLDDVRRHGERLAAFSPAVGAERRQTKDFLYENLYFSPALADEKDDAERVVGELFAFWMEHPEALPHNYQTKAKEANESLPRVICDYIAGMTDNFIFEQYEKHCGAA